ncbi:MAG: AP2 domain-containing protein [Salinivirgaceae bacterium]|jgi:hypothetical protein|nr:AP2 domain-containing protein [Desulfobacterales bacterium]MDY0282148.1 AP2 domain-containing protein [Salinivirgaceae bacterium]
MQEQADMAFITLVAYEKQRPHYWVRFAKSVKGKTELISHRRFYFHEYEGGQEESLFWAKDWRDWEYQELRSRGLIKAKGDWSGGVPPCYTTPRVDNKFGKCGVQRHDYMSIGKHVKQDGTISYYNRHNLGYSAVWIEYVEEDGIVRRRYRNKTFSIKKYGEDKAKRLASEARDVVEKYLRSREHLELRERYCGQRGQ